MSDEKSRERGVPTEEIGYDGFANREELVADGDLWAYLEKHTVLRIWCHGSSQLIATVHAHPDGSLWYRWRPRRGSKPFRFDVQVPVVDWLTDDGNVPVVCPAHGLQHLQPVWLDGEARSARRKVELRCTESVLV